MELRLKYDLLEIIRGIGVVHLPQYTFGLLRYKEQANLPEKR